MSHILFISGSLRTDSVNTKVLKAMESLLPTGTATTWANINLPLFNEELEADFPTDAETLRQQILAADAIIIATPEYNRAISGALKNALDWASRPYGQNAWAGKKVLVCSASPSGIGGATANYQVKQSLLHLNAIVIGQPEVIIGHAFGLFADDGTVIDETNTTLLQAAVDTILAT